MPVSHNTDNQEIVIDIETLDTATLRQLQKFTRKHLSARNTKKNPKQMEAMARKMNQGTQERIDFLKHQLEQQKMQSTVQATQASTRTRILAARRYCTWVAPHPP